MTLDEQVELWNAVHAYVRACGGNPESGPSEAKIVAVNRLGHIVDDIEAAGIEQMVRVERRRGGQLVHAKCPICTWWRNVEVDAPDAEATVRRDIRAHVQSSHRRTSPSP